MKTNEFFANKFNEIKKIAEKYENTKGFVKNGEMPEELAKLFANYDFDETCFGDKDVEEYVISALNNFTYVDEDDLDAMYNAFRFWNVDNSKTIAFGFRKPSDNSYVIMNGIAIYFGEISKCDDFGKVIAMIEEDGVEAANEYLAF